MTDPAETDFNPVFATEIVPRLDMLEQARRHELPRLRRRATAFAALTVAWLAALLTISIPLLWLTIVPLGAIGLFIVLQLRAPPGRDYAQALRAIVLPPLCAFAGGWRHERLDNRDIFRKGDLRVEPDWPLFSLPDWRTPIPPIVRTDISRLLALLASAQPPAYPVPPRGSKPGNSHKEPQVTK
ncbi:hypothetical protein SAE02_60350 [Skermanella aerolata]|uniref:Uncharacterized protein n=1 Tax=Skermanella aerolata TaxID=393310 RepID=A0A512DZH5_9PROT|nr:hypothetical protein [Skermanella aerolata]KJB92015.1 hypothetical protein N826_25365 [Skermanella aerolata KACC 11604]GEO41887.1 hypothetical protein SAE02_60350 [Skermanella aerolata]